MPDHGVLLASGESAAASDPSASLAPSGPAPCGPASQAAVHRAPPSVPSATPLEVEQPPKSSTNPSWTASATVGNALRSIETSLGATGPQTTPTNEWYPATALP